MEALNDDSIIAIFGYLDLKHQLCMINLHPRFYQLMPKVWSRQHKILKISLHEVNFSSDEADYFFSSIYKTIKVLHLKMMMYTDFSILTKYVYREVHDFRFQQHPNSSQPMTDKDIVKMLACFPNLKTFSPHGSFTGEHFAEFAFLERLTLSYCNRKFKIENLVRIMQAHKLKEIKLGLFYHKIIQLKGISLPLESMRLLEVIKVDLDELPWFDNHLRSLPNLKTLIIGEARKNDTLWQLCTKLHDAGRKNFEILETCNSMNSLRAVNQYNFHVDSLKIVTDNFILLNMHEISIGALNNVSELYLKSCFIVHASSLDALMENTQNVDFISLEQCTLMFNQYKFKVSDIVKQRYKMLKMNLFQNKFAHASHPWLWTVIGKSDLLVFAEGKDYSYTFEPIYISFK